MWQHSTLIIPSLIAHSLAVVFLHTMYIKYKQILVFNFVLDLLWTGGGSSVSSAAYLGSVS